MTTEAFNRLLQAKSFRQFDIRLADGQSIRVLHPDFVARSPSGRTAVVFGKGDDFSIVDLLLVASLQTVNGGSAGGRAGSKRR